MTIKITLITPPDIFQNDNDGILLWNLSEPEQEAATEWLGKFETEQDINIYFYQNETDMPWILHAMAAAKYKYIEINTLQGVTNLLAGYVIGKPNTYYSTNSHDISAVYGHFNQNRVSDVVDFFERTLGAERN